MMYHDVLCTISSYYTLIITTYALAYELPSYTITIIITSYSASTMIVPAVVI